jgi:hypothetical protein
MTEAARSFLMSCVPCRLSRSAWDDWITAALRSFVRCAPTRFELAINLKPAATYQRADEVIE